MYLLAGGGVVYGHEDETNSKVPMAYAMLEAIARRLSHPKPVSFYIDLRASGSRFGVGKKHTINEPAPIFSIAHKTAENGRGLLVPNPYFLDPSWWANYTRAIMALAAQRPWHSRRPAVLMRGACGPASFERLGVLKVPEFTDASRYDFGITSKAGPYDSIEDCIDKGMKGSSTEAEIARVKSRIMRKMPLEDFSRYRYALHMPGSVTNSYSRNLQHLFMQGVIVLIWQCDAVEFYYPLLRHRVHFMSVNASTLGPTVHELESSPRLRETLLAGGDFVARHVLSSWFLFARWDALLHPLRQLQTGDPRIPSTACSCNTPKYRECSFCSGRLAAIRDRVEHGEWV